MFAFTTNARVLCCYLSVLCSMAIAAGPAFAEDHFSDAVAGLGSTQPASQTAAAALLASSDHPRALPVLEAMLAGNLFERRDGYTLVIATVEGRGYAAVDAVSGEPIGALGKREVRRVALNNQLRRELRGLIARRQLEHDDVAIRRSAMRNMFATLEDDTAAIVAQLLETEADAGMRTLMRDALALRDLKAGDGERRRQAIAMLAGNARAEVRSQMEALANDPTLDEVTREEANRALTGIERKLWVYRLIETAFFGLSLGSVLVLAAIGLAITFGVMGVINMAHGELIMLGAYTTYVVQLLMPAHIGVSLFVAIPAAFLVAALVGIAIERGVIQFLYGRPLETLLATFGISLILQQTVRSIFSPLNRSVITPEWMSGSLEITAGLSLTYNRLYILGFTLLVFLALVALLQRTRLGLEVRAVAQNRNMARAMGVRSRWVDAMTFGLGSGVAGVAGVALSQLTNVGPNLGQAYIVDSFMVVVFGGVGNVWGTLVAGLTLGVTNKFLEPFAGAVMAKIVILVFIILFIQKRPRGLFPQKGRAADL